MQINPVQLAQYNNIAAPQNIAKSQLIQNTVSNNVQNGYQNSAAKNSDTISISAEAQKLARSEVNESSAAEAMESEATQVMEGERAAGGSNRISMMA